MSGVGQLLHRHRDADYLHEACFRENSAEDIVREVQETRQVFKAYLRDQLSRDGGAAVHRRVKDTPMHGDTGKHLSGDLCSSILLHSSAQSSIRDKRGCPYMP